MQLFVGRGIFEEEGGMGFCVNARGVLGIPMLCREEMVVGFFVEETWSSSSLVGGDWSASLFARKIVRSGSVGRYLVMSIWIYVMNEI